WPVGERNPKTLSLVGANTGHLRTGTPSANGNAVANAG
ncbi:MAG: hypothetical protein ACI8XO_003093, partial [Verrucomicrobiales bacterium]